MRISFDFDGTLVDEFGGHPSDYMNYKKKGVVYKRIYLFTLYISDISEICLTTVNFHYILTFMSQSQSEHVLSMLLQRV